MCVCVYVCVCVCVPGNGSAPDNLLEKINHLRDLLDSLMADREKVTHTHTHTYVWMHTHSLQTHTAHQQAYTRHLYTLSHKTMETKADRHTRTVTVGVVCVLAAGCGGVAGVSRGGRCRQGSQPGARGGRCRPG